MTPTIAVLSAGSNIGDRLAHLTSVTDRLAGDLIAVSPVYSTPPWGGVEQGDFYNITLIASADRNPYEWLELCHELEQAADRTRDIRWGPRTLDVDVISVVADGDVVRSEDPTLLLPHPRAAERAFVLVPWLAIDADATLWTSAGERRVVDLVERLGAQERDGVVPVAELPVPASRRTEPPESTGTHGVSGR
ncbi:2-amino-4-hydroxy-6-hydroxymethyldihydropteridine diphosphokinase [Gordonia sp. OPL2]|uniref:2-amino-4-hydroxy-6- hydroxymethyldihydropteridine diphosphokinase n=1 Tax=Gordonia sp. OPL2 TaxID=2486274 RepID=UPI00165627C7|nr:2-amino-4-hydroxy-6-hydroxymethyldihydropteridine diphosphokinase [Gordonia sp. OPL2]ROZ88739.1 2-amino-4-hydroxy-6-hydroxymethyldihydropteridine diphosphokinase [Gordonia sp. OPL2]